jgi:uncharacterized protein (TIGR03089 family)
MTFYDDATGERAELSGTTMANWVAKTANMLIDGHGLDQGDVAVVRLPPHWQTAAVLLGCWSAGVAVNLGGTPRAATMVAFVAAERLYEDGVLTADETFSLALAPLAAPMRPGPPPGVLDYVVEVRPHGDVFRPISPISPDAPALTGDDGAGISHAELVERAVARAAETGLTPGARVLIDAEATLDPGDWLLAPLAAGASVVLCRHLDPARLEARLAAERATPYSPMPSG